MRKYKILHLITQLVYGGSQDNTIITAEGLDREFFEVHLASSPGGEWWGRAEQAVDQIFVIPSLRRGIHPVASFRAFVEILSLLWKEKYDLIHTHGSVAGLLGRWAARLAGVPVIFHTVHGFGFNDQTLSPWQETLLVKLERTAARVSDLLLMQSEHNLNQALELSVAPSHKLVKVNSGIRLDPFTINRDVEDIKRGIGISNPWPVVGWVGRFTPANAPDVFLKACKGVLDNYPEVNIVIVGDGELFSNCVKMIQPGDPITLLGQREDVPTLLAAFDIFVSTVRWAGLGRALTEAMLAGLPVIAPEVSGIPEIVQDGHTGLLFPVDRSDLLKDKIIYLLNNPTYAKELGANARDLVWDQFSAQKMVRQTQDLYLEYLDRKAIQ